MSDDRFSGGASEDPSGTYEVGYGKPPVATRFQKGRSGNPRGRAKGRKSIETIVNEVLAEPVTVTEKGRTRTISTSVALMKRLRQKALEGDMRAVDRMLELAGRYAPQLIMEDTMSVLDEDRRLIDAYHAKLTNAGLPEAKE